MVRLSRYDLEKIAQRVIRAYMKLPVFEGKRIYNISPQILLENLLKLRVDYCHLSLGSGFNVAAINSDPKRRNRYAGIRRL